jgi:hypothetical protein
MKKKNIATVKEHRYVLDWFDIRDVEIDLDAFAFFELQLRTGQDWYLMHYVMEPDSCRAKNVYKHDFRCSNPSEAVNALGDNLKRFSCSCNGGKYFTDNLEILLKRASK